MKKDDRPIPVAVLKQWLLALDGPSLRQELAAAGIESTYVRMRRLAAQRRSRTRNIDHGRVSSTSRTADSAASEE